MRVRVLLIALLCLPRLAFAETADEALWRHRNLGKAFYENPTTQYEAVDEFKAALDLAPNSAREHVNYGLALMRAGKEAEGIAELEKAQQMDPSIPHTWFNLGIAYKQQGQYDKAIAQLEQFLKLVPGEAIAHYNLGVLYKLQRKNDVAVMHFEKAAALDPHLAGAQFQLATAYRIMNRAEDAAKAMATFRQIKAAQANAAVPEDLEWCSYAEIYETIDPAQAAVAAPSGALTFDSQALADGLSGGGMTVLDANADQTPDLLVWSHQGVALFSGGRTRAVCGLEGLKDVTAIAPGDFDNDGRTDLCVITSKGGALYRNAGGKFEALAAALPRGTYRKAVWLDYDHDYDLDLFLLGPKPVLLRNNGAAGFSDETGSFPFVDGDAVDGVAFEGVADTQGMDLAVVYAGRPGVLYRDLLGGKYAARDLPELKGTAVSACDFNNDGWMDLAAASAQGVALLANDHNGEFRVAQAFEGTGSPVAFADFENRTVADLATGRAVFRNLGKGAFGTAETPAGWRPATALCAADFDMDGLADLGALDADGSLVLLRNATRGKHWLRVALQGVKNPVLAAGARVEMKVGARYQKRMYEGLPLVFGLGDDAQADAVRITWPNGLIQNETRQAAGQSPVYKEAQRLSGSCPMIFTWNGKGFEFITDVLGVAPLGASAGDGTYFPVDHDEYVQIPGSALASENGRFQIRVTEELREVSYLDAIKLIAVDHPADVDIFTNDKFKAPPFPEFRLFGVKTRHYPISARDGRGRDVREKLLAMDRTYPDGFARDYAGVAELHHLDLDFGNAAPDGKAVLILNGWVDWADGSTFLGMAQQNRGGLILPSLQVKDAQGNWKTVIADMGIPSGKPKTIAVDLSGKFLSASRQVRIVTNLCVYWDEIFLSETPEAPTVRLTDVLPDSAMLRFRGFSDVVVDPQRKQPEQFVYDRLRPMTEWNWNPTPGMYTRYGSVPSLIRDVDDLLVIMGSGDELQLRFDATHLPALTAGWRRDFLLMVDGWAKDGDANTAFSQSVTPLPYHGMPQYPYAAPNAFPSDGLHQRYLEAYISRPALRLIRPLYEGAAPDVVENGQTHKVGAE